MDGHTAAAVVLRDGAVCASDSNNVFLIWPGDHIKSFRRRAVHQSLCKSFYVANCIFKRPAVRPNAVRCIIFHFPDPRTTSSLYQRRFSGSKWLGHASQSTSSRSRIRYLFVHETYTQANKPVDNTMVQDAYTAMHLQTMTAYPYQKNPSIDTFTYRQISPRSDL